MGNINGNRVNRQAPIPLAAEKMAGLFPGISVNTADKAIFFKNGNKLLGTDGALLGMLPAKQSFSGNRHGMVNISYQLINWLKFHEELSFL